MCLQKHYAEAGQVSLCEGYLYFKVSVVLIKELRLAMTRRKKTAVPAGRRKITSGNGTRASQQRAGKRKDNEQATSGDFMEPANRRTAPSAGSFPVSATSSFKGEQALPGSRHARPSRVGPTYASLLGEPVLAKWDAQDHSQGFGPTRNR